MNGRSLFLLPEQAAIPPRVIWAANRFWMESENMKSKRWGGESHHRWYVLLFLMKALKVFLQLTVAVRKGWRKDDRALKEFGFLLTS